MPKKAPSQTAERYLASHEARDIGKSLNFDGINDVGDRLAHTVRLIANLLQVERPVRVKEVRNVLGFADQLSDVRIEVLELLTGKKDKDPAIDPSLAQRNDESGSVQMIHDEEELPSKIAAKVDPLKAAVMTKCGESQMNPESLLRLCVQTCLEMNESDSDIALHVIDAAFVHYGLSLTGKLIATMHAIKWQGKTLEAKQ